MLLEAYHNDTFNGKAPGESDLITINVPQSRETLVDKELNAFQVAQAVSTRDSGKGARLEQLILDTIHREPYPIAGVSLAEVLKDMSENARKDLEKAIKEGSGIKSELKKWLTNTVSNKKRHKSILVSPSTGIIEKVPCQSLVDCSYIQAGSAQDTNSLREKAGIPLDHKDDWVLVMRTDRGLYHLIYNDWLTSYDGTKLDYTQRNPDKLFNPNLEQYISAVHAASLSTKNQTELVDKALENLSEFLIERVKAEVVSTQETSSEQPAQEAPETVEEVQADTQTLPEEPTQVEKAPTPTVTKEAIDYSSLSNKNLRDLANKRNIDTKGFNKARLIEALQKS